MEGYRMSAQIVDVDDLLDRIEDLYTADDVLYIIGKDLRWFLRQHLALILKHRRDFGDDGE